MGVVYKAEDTKLKRPVALKFLAGHLLQDEESRQRFQREARAGAAINHPNICMVHEIGEADGQTFLAMEFVAGQGVKEKIETRPLKLEEALDIATQTAQGLQEAHEKGIVHRDIKPANLMVNEKGQVKIMDFGLAQLASRSKLTKTGTTLGTMAYMSPEQVQGEPTDHRSDIWSLGVVLYEMVTGQLPFKGDYGQVVGYNILNEEPEPITALRAGLPMELEWIVGKALAKDAAERYQHVEEIIVDLRSLHGKLVADVSTPTPAETADRRVMPQPTPQERLSRHHRVHRVLIAVSVLSISAAVAFGVLWWLRAPTPGGERPLRRFTLMPQESVFWPVVSPDGRFIAYLTKPSAETVALWVHNLSEDDARIIGGPDEAIWNTQPFWSPDSKILVFRSGNELKKIPVEGGAVTALCEVRSSVGPFGGSWAPDGETIVFAQPQELRQVPAGGGVSRRWLEMRREERIQFGWPHFLPSETGDRKLLYVEINEARDGQIVAHDLNKGQRENLVSGFMPVYAPSGHILYRKRDPAEIWAVPFSIETMTATGEPFAVRQNASRPSVASDGTLVYVERGARVLWAGLEQLVWRDREGKHLGWIGQPQEGLWHPALSPNEEQVAVRGFEGGPWSDIWIHEVSRPVKTLFTTRDGSGGIPIWSPGGDRIAYSSGRGASRGVFVKAADGSGEAVALLSSRDSWEYVTDWGPQGTPLVLTRVSPGEGSRARSSDIWYLKRKNGVST